MARKTNDNFKSMSLNQIESYVGEHPSEGLRAAKIVGKTAAFCIQEHVTHAIGEAKKSVTPLQPSNN